MSKQDLVLVIGGAGAQGAAVVKELVKDKKYRARVLTRDTSSRRAQEIFALGNVELVQGTMTSEADLQRALQGVDLAFVNLDTFTLGEAAEVFWAMRIFELSIQAGVRHFVWGGLEYGTQLTGYNPKYRCAHYDAKGRFTQWMRGQPAGKIIWSALDTCPYMDMLLENFLPKVDADGTYVFSSPLGNGSMPMVALDDVGFYARWLFEHPEKSAGLELRVSSEEVTWKQIAETFTEVTGKPAKHVDVPLDAYIASVFQPDATIGPNGIKWVDSFTGWWHLYRDQVLNKDYKTLYEIHPNHLTLKSWMIKVNYQGTHQPVLKDIEDGAIMQRKKASS